MFQLDSVSLAYEGHPLFQEFSLEIPKGAKVVLTGPSGSGKSTLLRLLLGFTRPDSGVVRFQDQELTPEVAHDLRRKVAYVGQSIQLEGGTVEDSMRALLTLRAGPGLPDRKEEQAALESLGLEARFLKRRTKDLSGGEAQRIALATALLLKRQIFLLDEPTAALDGALKAMVADRFLDSSPHWTVIAVAHDECWTRSDCAQVIRLPKDQD